MIYAEHDGARPRRSALESASCAADVARSLGGEVHALVLGDGATGTLDSLGMYGVDVVHASDDACFDRYLVEPGVEVAAMIVEAIGPAAVIFPYSQDGKDIASRLGARLDCGIVANVIALDAVGDQVEATETIFGGNYTTRVHGKGDGPLLILARPNAFTAQAKERTARPEAVNYEPSERAKRVARGQAVQEEGTPLAVDEASIIVSGGRGLGGPGPFVMLQELATELGGVVGASRAAVDAGWISYPHQVGQTGKTVKPQVYIAIGISGAVQHRVGMQTADTIIAINRDADAPIFGLADFGAVGDLFQIVPALTEEIRKRKSA